MNFNTHPSLEGQHAFLGASKYHWLNYTEDKLVDSYYKFSAAQKGTELHAFAKECIRLGIKLPKTKKTLNMYVNDAIGFRMTPEQPLFYSYNCFGTADTIAFRNNFLRVHDYKSGVVTPGSMHQLEIYAALFCLEYSMQPSEIEIELRIYQFDDIVAGSPPPEDISEIMSKIVLYDRVIDKIKLEGV